MADLSLIANCSIPRQAGAYNASEMQCLLENESSYSTKVVFSSWFYRFLPSYNDDVFCVGTIRKREKFKVEQKTQSTE